MDELNKKKETHSNENEMREIEIDKYRESKNTRRLYIIHASKYSSTKSPLVYSTADQMGQLNANIDGDENGKAKH